MVRLVHLTGRRNEIAAGLGPMSNPDDPDQRGQAHETDLCRDLLRTPGGGRLKAAMIEATAAEEISAGRRRKPSQEAPWSGKRYGYLIAPKRLRRRIVSRPWEGGFDKGASNRSWWARGGAQNPLLVVLCK